MTDSLRKIVNALDRSRARTHRLTGDQVVAERGGTSARKVCGSCWHVVDEQAELQRWYATVDCGHIRGGADWCMGHWRPPERPRWMRHDFPGVTGCPSCGGVLSEVTW